MIAVKVQIDNLTALRSNFHRAPATALKYLSKATSASIFEIEKQAVDQNFQFKTPRALRTGLLQQSFSYGRYFAPGGLYASIGPTVHYAPYVYYGTRRGIRPNPYMDRIASAAEPDIRMPVPHTSSLEFLWPEAKRHQPQPMISKRSPHTLPFPAELSLPEGHYITVTERTLRVVFRK